MTDIRQLLKTFGLIWLITIVFTITTVIFVGRPTVASLMTWSVVATLTSALLALHVAHQRETAAATDTASIYTVGILSWLGMVIRRIFGWIWFGLVQLWSLIITFWRIVLWTVFALALIALALGTVWLIYTYWPDIVSFVKSALYVDSEAAWYLVGLLTIVLILWICWQTGYLGYLGVPFVLALAIVWFFTLVDWPKSTTAKKQRMAVLPSVITVTACDCCDTSWTVVQLPPRRSVRWNAPVLAQYQRNGSWYDVRPGEYNIETNAFRFCDDSYLGGQSMQLIWNRVR